MNREAGGFVNSAVTVQFTKLLASWSLAIPSVRLVLFYHSTEWEPPYRTLSRDNSVRQQDASWLCEHWYSAIHKAAGLMVPGHSMI